MELFIVVQACQIVQLKRSNFGSAYKNVECLLVNALKFHVEIFVYPTFAPIARHRSDISSNEGRNFPFSGIVSPTSHLNNFLFSPKELAFGVTVI
jgi:hypothetical protein